MTMIYILAFHLKFDPILSCDSRLNAELFSGRSDCGTACTTYSYRVLGNFMFA
jgi:hypothetical protein